MAITNKNLQPVYVKKARLNLVNNNYDGVYDGDTVYLDIDVFEGVVKENERIRLYGLNTKEIRGVEREEGLIAKAFVKAKLTNCSEMIVETIKDKRGKYGRLLGIIWYKNADEDFFTNLNSELLEEGIAEVYVP